MSQKYLGETFDIHGGGKDLIFPHHENEIAQSEAATEKPFARYWIHNGFVNINKEKMSKSLGNILTIKEILKQWHPEVLRLFFLSHHYRSPVDYSEEGLSKARTGLDRFYATLYAIQQALKQPVSTLQKKADSSAVDQARKAIETFQIRFEEAMDDDFNTAQALGYFYDLQTALNSLLDRSRDQTDETTRSLLGQGYELFRRMGKVLGLFVEEPEAYMDRQKREGLKRLGLSEEEVLKQIDERNNARKSKDWKKADEIRNSLLSKGIVLEDTPSGTNWKLK
jgi:cysteinyl-tRNA synthetase